MKKLLIFSAILPVLFMACAEEPLPSVEPPAPTPEEAEIKIDVTSIVIPAEGGSETIRFNSSQKWEAEVKSSQDNSWCTISPKSGAAGDASVTITAKASNDVNSRTAILTIKSGKIKKAINVSQKQKDALTVTSSVFEVDAEGGDISITVKANIEFEYMISDECAGWISFTGTKAMTTHNLSFAIASNDETKSRQGKITIYSGSLQEEITIKQKGKEISYEEVWAKEREILMNFYTATGGDNWTDNTNWGSALPVSEWYGIRTDEDGLVIGISLQFNNLTGSIPEGLSGLERLSTLDLYYNNLTGSIPAEIGSISNLHLIYLNDNEFSGSIPPELSNLINLEYLELSKNQLTGNIPSELRNLQKLYRLSLFDNRLSGSIPAELGELSNLEELYLYNNDLTGSIPAELASLSKLKICVLWGNKLSGRVPQAIMDHPCWATNWHLILNQSDYGISEEGIEIYAPEFSVKTISGETLTNDIFSKNKLTVIYHFLDWCPFAETFTPRLIGLYEMFKDLGLGAFSVTSQDEAEVQAYVDKHRIPWPCTVNQQETGTFVNYIDRTPTVTVCNPDGLIVFNSALRDYGELADFLTEQLGSPSDIDPDYKSSDYSKDGEVKVLQKASKGNGIDIILMGDAYSDRLIADGTYENIMKLAMEKFFATEPFKTYRDLFNVYSVTAVSENEAYTANSSTALSGYFGADTHVGGNDFKAMEYARKAISEERMNDAVIVVMMNSTAFAGTCYMYDPVHSAELDYFGNGTSVAYFPVGVNEEALEQLIRHEAGGHGFAKLADEYAYRNNGAIPYFKVAETEAKEEFGWWKNIDFTNNPSDVKWSGFINDERYSDEGIGVFEGGLTYWMGVYRPTEDSAMNSGIGGYNAPSREAIYYRIHKLAYGQSWEYDRNDFIKYDLDCKTPQTRSVNIVNSSYDLPAPPVITGKTWKERMNDR
ncbi:MAG: redoxin domain-containing protein [Bacteroidales bacterium]|nr:redoxin domain-containing protein [Bacteroidales bacterium]